MDEPTNRLNLFRLAECCSLELVKRKRKEAADDSYCLEIFHRAIHEQDEEAWSALHGCFSEHVRMWLHSHIYKDMALSRDSEENYVAQTFSRFWVAVHKQRQEFETLNSALCYLNATLDGILRDMMRSHLRSQEVPLPEQGAPDEPVTEPPGDDLDVWNTFLGRLKNDRERRVVQLLYYHGLKPKKIVEHFPQEFPSEKEICRINDNIKKRLKRQPELLSWLFSR